MNAVIQRWHPTKSALILVAWIWIISLLTISLRRFNLFGAQAFDLGIFQQGVWLLANGLNPFVTIRGWHLFADHFSPILFVFVPFYKFFPHPFGSFSVKLLL
jgi:Predicted membrane protein